MKTLWDIKNEVARERYADVDESWNEENYQYPSEMWNEVCRRAQLECARETLKGLAGQLNQQISFGYVALHSITDEGNIKLVE